MESVSEKEKTRNEAVFSLQKNRNPYIDFPDLAEYVWGDRKNESFDPDAGSSPAIIHPVDGSIVDLGINTVNSQLSYMLNIKARNLKGDISLSVTDNHFSVSRSVLTKEEAERGVNVELTCNLADVLEYSGTLIITGGGLENAVSISLKAQAVSNIPALPATDITSEGFLARWVHLPSIKEVTLHVYTRDGDKILPLDGYPRQCFSEDQEAWVTGISYDTTYYYRVTSGDMGSNEISVFIPAPVPMISVASLDGDLNFSTEPGMASETKRVNITGKYTYEQIHVMVDEPFEISVDNREGFRQIDLSSAGGTVWVRLSDSAPEGEHVSELLVSSEEIEEEEILPLSGLVAVKKAFFEDFETGSKGSYASGVVTCSKGRWLFDDALMGAQNGDLKQGKKSARIRNGYIEMQDDKAGGIGTVFTAVYLLLGILLYFHRRPVLLNELISFATQYGQVQKSLMKNFALPYALLDAEGKIDFNDKSVTENTRVSYPINHIENIVRPVSSAPAAKNVIFLSADAFGVLPPVSVLTPEQTEYYFLSGFTAKLAGTERGITEPTPTFSACFGQAFLELHPTKYAEELVKRMKESGAKAYLVNTGWNGSGKRISIKDTRGIIDAILDGSILSAPTKKIPFFNFEVPTELPGVDPKILDPRDTYADASEWEEKAKDLAARFVKNFAKYEGNEIGKALVAAGPQK